MLGGAITGADKAYHVVLKGLGEVALKPGEVISATVAVVDGANKSATLIIKGMAMEVKTELALKAGEAIALKVEGSAVDGEIRLRIMEPSPEGPAKVGPIKEFLSLAIKGMGAAKLSSAELTSLKNLIDSIPKAVLDKLPELKGLKTMLDSLPVLAGADMKAVVKGSGLFFESGLKGMVLLTGLGKGGVEAGLAEKMEKFVRGDLKGSLLVLSTALKKPEVIELLLKSGIKADDVSAAIEKLTANIELRQFQSKMTDSINLFLPVFWKNLKDGAVVFKGPDEGVGTGGKGSSCNISLDLDDIGKMTVRVTLDPTAVAVHVAFTAESRDFLALVEENSETLKQGLAEAGLRIANLSTRHEPEIDFARILSAKDEGLDIVV